MSYEIAIVGAGSTKHAARSSSSRLFVLCGAGENTKFTKRKRSVVLKSEGEVTCKRCLSLLSTQSTQGVTLWDTLNP